MASRALLFETERLRVRQIDERDFDAMVRIYGDLEAMKYVGDGTALTRESCLAWIEITRNNYATQGYGLSCIVSKQTGHTIGFCGFTHPGQQADPELKYCLEKASWGKGFATEVGLGMVAYGAAELGLNRIIATVDAAHSVSRHVLAKCGLALESSSANDDGSGSEVWARHVEIASQTSSYPTAFTIRKYCPGDAPSIGRIYRDAVHQIAKEHYTQAQLKAWAPRQVDYPKWEARCEEKQPFLAMAGMEIAGFLELDLEATEAHVDCAYVNPRFARMGAISILIEHALGICRSKGLTAVRVEASECARPLFEKYGFQVLELQQVEVRGEVLSNSRMRLELES
ncbi:MAG: RimJ/RimL family protein N-acetyltransferase/ribosomal protein S18 acetylase RimI-like enzyme [Planctomycetota bacterium]|jgi:RimJ/RimL family protein N-acetyltransferase/ribosomal protein S18 acetylase RimI-like enzyme